MPGGAPEHPQRPANLLSIRPRRGQGLGSATNTSVSAAAAVISTALGVGMIGLAARDVFDALFHPEGRGTFARLISRAVWWLFRRPGPHPGLFPLAGPVALISVIAIWASLLVVGWAVIYWPHLPEGFSFSQATAPSGSFVEALHISLVTLTTLGFGDVTPHAPALRLLVPLEGLLGFGLLSASISWLLLIYPVLSRRRSLAYEITLLRGSGGSVARLEPEALERLYTELTSRLVAVERDLVSFPISYYFAEEDPRFSLAASAPYLIELVDHGASREEAGVRLRAELLRQATDDLAATAAVRFHRDGGGTTEEVLRAYARDHLRD
jgi:ion channel